MNYSIPAEAEYYLDEFDAERFWAHVNQRGGTTYVGDPLARATGECWTWNGDASESYAKFRVFGTWQSSHRVAYKDFGNKIPDGLDLDHLCRVHNCVNPAHMEPVTRAVNVGRGSIGSRTHCKNGHEFTDENTRMVKRGLSSYRLCKTCRKAYKSAEYQRRKQAA